MISKSAEAVLNRAVKHAFDREHEFFALEHVLLSLLEERDVVAAVQACGKDPEALKKDVLEYLDRDSPKAQKRPDGSVEHPVATLSIQRLVQRALIHIQSSGKDEILPIDLFVALFQCKDSYALHLLEKHGIERLDVLDFVSHGLTKEGATDSNMDYEGDELAEGPDDPEGTQGRGSRKQSKSDIDPLKAYTQNLNQWARDGKIDPLVGRANELERMIQTLCRRRKNNPILVGEAGVGKTALAEGLALRIVAGEVPDFLKSCELYALDLGALLAGAKFRGDFEQRLKRVLKALQAKSENDVKPVLVIDEIHTLIGAGAVSGGAMDAANMLKPLLSKGELRCIGSTTFAEYRNVFEKDHALSRRFQKIDIVEPSQEETEKILLGLKEKLEGYHKVTIEDSAIKSAVELSSKHITDRFNPDKSLDILDEAGARARIKGVTVIKPEFIEEVVALIARIPARSVSTSQKDRLKNLDRDLKLSIFGQDHAIESIVNSIRLARSGLRSGEKPIGSFLFCGPTGVGKTELAKQLSHALGVPFLRFDMSEYGEKHTVSRLIGAPPGYVGFDQAGLLTDALIKNPHCVVLLDEIEKAHPDIWNILLQVMDHGFLTDNNGKKADFRNSILLMTSNVGSRDLERRQLGMGGGSPTSGEGAKRAVEQTFSPEFRNRLDSIVYFNPLSPQTVAQVVGKQLLELESQLLSKKIDADFTTELRDYLAQKGYDRQMGARPMARLIQEEIKKPLSHEILFGPLEHGGTVRVTVKDGKPVFEIEARTPPSSVPSTPSEGGASQFGPADPKPIAVSEND